MLRVVSWNVNGLRANTKKGFLDWLNGSGAHIVGLQETRAHKEQIASYVAEPEGWFTDFVSAQRGGYSGVAFYCRNKPDTLDKTLGIPDFDIEGRFHLARFGELTVVNAYFPNGAGKDRDNSRIPYKLAFYKEIFELLEDYKNRGERILVMGDFNTAHQDIDIARPKENQNTSGFCPIEREEFDRWIQAGWVDTFRHFNKEPGNYSWWNSRFGARARNIGWRIDYVLASPGAMPFVKNAFIWPEVQGSDHCPVGIDVEETIVGDINAIRIGS